jgi:hypothetical protein
MSRICVLIVFLIITACSKQQVTVGPEKTGTQILQVAMPGKEVMLQGHGQEIGLGVGAMAGTKEAPANGVAILHIFEDGFVSMSVNLNIAVAEDGMFYEAWIMPSGSATPLSLGHLQNRFGDVRHSVTYEGEVDLDGATDVTVTLEADDGDPSMSRTVVATGKLKPVSRQGITPTMSEAATRSAAFTSSRNPVAP